MIQQLQLIGLFNIDLVTSKGKWYFVEINIRFAAYGYAVYKAGVNLPAFQIFSMFSMDDSCLSKKVKREVRYVNEKVAFDDLAAGYRTWNNYKDMVTNADCHIIQQTDDPEPYHEFKKGLKLKFLKTRIKKIIKKYI